jgi:hypothetical protein
VEVSIIACANHELELETKETMAFGKPTMTAAAPNAPAHFAVLASWLSRHARL